MLLCATYAGSSSVAAAHDAMCEIRFLAGWVMEAAAQLSKEAACSHQVHLQRELEPSGFRAALNLLSISKIITLKCS